MKEIMSIRNQEILGKAGHIVVGYLTAGYPDKTNFLDALKRCEEAGIDIFEIGYPSKNPNADGEVIQHAHKMVEQSIATDMEFWQEVRNVIQSPIWVMAYKKDIMDHEFYLELAKAKIIDAIVIPDMTFEERQEIQEKLVKYQVDVVGFISPDMEESVIAQSLENEALMYQQLYAGPTGMAVTSDTFSKLLHQTKKYPNVKVFAGFGISTPERVEELLYIGFDGVIVGTAMIRKLNTSIDELVKFVTSLKEAAERVKNE